MHDEADQATDGVTGARADSSAPSTGDAVVDEALRELARLDELELSRHPAVVDAVQGALAERLAESD